ncbi:MAG TPA: translocation/assembly module TamB domain-containing protein [Alphaproteobacteria bacterium]|nr:translocation/assembly module TamB domain-containing protein [Alphaproteobacteria bacterium]
MRRALILIPLLLLGLPILAMLAAFAWVQTPPGKRQLVQLAEGLATTPSMEIRIGGLEGFVPFDFAVTDIALADANGVWLTADRVRLDWAPLALFGRVLHVEALEAGAVRVARPPVPTAEAEEPPSEPTGKLLPDLPVAIKLDRLDIGEIALGEPVLGRAIGFTAHGRAQLSDPSKGLDAHLDVRRVDAEGALTLDLRFVPETEALTVDLVLDEPPDGIIANVADMPGRPPVTATIAGDGTLDDWQATLAASAGDLLDLTAKASTSAVAEGRTISVDAMGRLAGLLPDDLAPLVAEGVDLSARLMLPTDGQLRIDGATLAAAAGTVTIDGTVNLADEEVDVGYRLEAGAPAVFADLVPDAEWEVLTLAGRATGALGHPAVGAAVNGRGVEAFGTVVDRIRADFEVDPSGPLGAAETTVTLASHGTVDGLAVGAAAVDGLTRSTIAWTVDGAFSPTGDVALDRLEVVLPSGRLEAQGDLEGWGLETADFVARLDVPDLAELQGLLGRPVDGSVALEADASVVNRSVVATLDGTMTEIATGVSQLDGLLGDRATLAAKVSVDPDGAIDLSHFTLDGVNLRAKTAGIIADGGLVLDWSLVLPDLAAADPMLAGAVRAEGNVSGPLEAPTAQAAVEATEVVAAGREVPRATLQVSAGRLTEAPTGRVDLAATVEGLPADLHAAFAVRPEGGAALDDLALSFGSLRLAGSLAVAPEGTATGRMEGSVGDLADFSTLVGQSLAGSAELTVAFAVPDGAQRVEARATVDGLAYGETARIDGLTFDAAVADALAAPDIDVDLQAEGVAAAGQNFETVALSATGPLRGGLDGALDVNGTQAAVAAAATVTQDADGTRIALRTFDGRYAGETFRLAAPATIAFGPAGATVDDLRLALDRGSVRLDGTYGDRYDLVLQVDGLPLDLARLAAPGIGGTLDGEVQLTGTPSTPDGAFSFRAQDVVLDQAVAAGIAPFGMTLDGTWQDERLSTRASLTVPGGGDLAVTAALPLAAGAGGVPAMPEDAPVDVRADGRFDLALLNPFLATGGDEVRGMIAVALQLGGSLEQPAGTGTVTLSDGSYRNSLNGTEITDIEAVLTAREDTLVLTSLNGATPGGGTLTGSGMAELNPEGGFPADFRLGLRNAQLIDSQLVTARVTADLRLAGALLDQALLSGPITIDHAEIRIPEALPPSVASIPVREVNAPPEIAARLEREERAAGGGEQGSAGEAFAVGLDLRVQASQQVFVRGRGLEAEMGGDLAITGSSAAPVVEGAFDLRRGMLDLLGNQFTFERGRVTLTGDTKIDPLLDFMASSDIGNIVAQIAITGRASSPEFDISSMPDLPDDEVLARILFGKATGELSAFEAVQLAQSVATLTGMTGGPGLLGDVRSATGLDRLSVGTDEGGQASVTAGKYLAEGVFVGVEQGVGGSSTATVEIEVTPNVTVESDIGADSGSRVGVTIEWDY